MESLSFLLMEPEEGLLRRLLTRLRFELGALLSPSSTKTTCETQVRRETRGEMGCLFSYGKEFSENQRLIEIGLNERERERLIGKVIGNGTQWRYLERGDRVREEKRRYKRE
jgi:hypothetical protein